MTDKGGEPTKKPSVLSRIAAQVDRGDDLPHAPPEAAPNPEDEVWIQNCLDGGGEERVLFDRDEVLAAMHGVRQQILERAHEIDMRMSASLHNAGDKIRHLIRELEVGQKLVGGDQVEEPADSRIRKDAPATPTRPAGIQDGLEPLVPSIYFGDD